MIGKFLSVVVVAGAMVLAYASSVAAVTVEPKPRELPASPVFITSYQVNEGLSFTQFYNSSDSIVALEGWRLEYVTKDTSGESEFAVELDGWILPKEYMVIAGAGIVKGADSEHSLPTMKKGAVVTELRLHAGRSYAPNVIASGFESGVRYDLSVSSAGNYTKTSTFKPVEESTPLYGGGLYQYPSIQPLRVVEIAANKADCAPLDETPRCFEFVKLYNPSTAVVDLSQFRLRLGYANQPATSTNTIQLEGSIKAGGYVPVLSRNDGKPLSIAASGGSVWIEDTYGLKAYENSVVKYEDLGSSAHKGLSWAQDTHGTWRWASPTPATANRFVSVKMQVSETADVKPCRLDQYRNPDTNRCRLKVSARSTNASCKEGQYRNPSTNRCRNVQTASASLRPCASGSYRHPETNRCRKNTTEESLKPCPEGKERNPETNRCRNSTASIEKADFAPEPVKAAAGGAIAWWALGGVGALALGRVGWEWREEIGSSIRRVGSAFTGNK